MSKTDSKDKEFDISFDVPPTRTRSYSFGGSGAVFEADIMASQRRNRFQIITGGVVLRIYRFHIRNTGVHRYMETPVNGYT